MSDWMIRRRQKKQADYERKFEESRKQQLLKHGNPSPSSSMVVRSVEFKQPIVNDTAEDYNRNNNKKNSGKKLKLNDDGVSSSAKTTTRIQQTKVVISSTTTNSGGADWMQPINKKKWMDNNNNEDNKVSKQEEPTKSSSTIGKRGQEETAVSSTKDNNNKMLLETNNQQAKENYPSIHIPILHEEDKEGINQEKGSAPATVSATSSSPKPLSVPTDNATEQHRDNDDDDDDDAIYSSDDDSFDLLAAFRKSNSQSQQEKSGNNLKRSNEETTTEDQEDDKKRKSASNKKPRKTDRDRQRPPVQEIVIQPEERAASQSVNNDAGGRSKPTTTEKEEDSIMKRGASKKGQKASSDRKQPGVPSVVSTRDGLTLNKNDDSDNLIKLITLNVAEFIPHNNAPIGFSPRQAFLDLLEQHQPDILAVQELPSSCRAFHNYQCVGTDQSHCGLVGLFVRNKFLSEQNASVSRLHATSDSFQEEFMRSRELPAVLGSIRWHDDGGGRQPMIIGSCHLAPYKEGAPTRLAQIDAMSQIIGSDCRMVIAGDMNMRGAEDKSVEAVGNWKDAWKVNGSIKSKGFTWNSNVNKYHANGFGFHCRFDRVYFRNIRRIPEFNLIANKPMINPQAEKGHDHYYLSDHFGIMTTVLIEGRRLNK